MEKKYFDPIHRDSGLIGLGLDPGVLLFSLSPPFLLNGTF